MSDNFLSRKWIYTDSEFEAVPAQGSSRSIFTPPCAKLGRGPRASRRQRMRERALVILWIHKALVWLLFHGGLFFYITEHRRADSFGDFLTEIFRNVYL